MRGKNGVIIWVQWSDFSFGEEECVGFMMGTPDAHSCRRLEGHQYSDIDESD